MERIDAPGATVDNRFTEGNEAGAIPATEVSAEWLNNVQEEVCAVIESAGLTLNGSVQNQLLQAINILIDRRFPNGVVVFWSGSIASIPAGYRFCDGTNGTANLRDKFVVGAGGAYTVGATGGAASVTSGNGGGHTPTMLAAGLHGHTAALSGSHSHTTNVAGDHAHGVTVNGTTLTTAQMPIHAHSPYQNLGSFFVFGNGGGAFVTGSSNPNVTTYGVTGDTGGSQSHTHGGSTANAGGHSHSTTTDPGHTHATDQQGSHVHTVNAVPDHTHTVSTLPPYYALAFIMKVAA